MPNIRKKGKQKVTFWLTETQRNKMKALAEDAGLNMTDMFKEMLDAYVQYRGIRLPFPEVGMAITRKDRKTNEEKTSANKSR